MSLFFIPSWHNCGEIVLNFAFVAFISLTNHQISKLCLINNKQKFQPLYKYIIDLGPIFTKSVNFITSLYRSSLFLKTSLHMSFQIWWLLHRGQHIKEFRMRQLRYNTKTDVVILIETSYNLTNIKEKMVMYVA